MAFLMFGVLVALYKSNHSGPLTRMDKILIARRDFVEPYKKQFEKIVKKNEREK